MALGANKAATLLGEFWRVWALCAVVPLEVLQAVVRNTHDKDERCEIVAVDRVSAHNTVGNVRWLVPMAIDRLTNPEVPKKRGG